jgi:hypothetical protein
MRMKGWILTVVSAVSLLLLAMVVRFLILDCGSLKSREFGVTVPGGSGTGGRIYGLYLCDGSLFAALFDNHPGPCSWDCFCTTDEHESLGLYCEVMIYDYGLRMWPHLERFGVAHVSDRPANELFRSARVLMLPGWVPIAILLLMPLATLRTWFRKRRLMKRLDSGLCLNCGYDLRASLERCPECGRNVPTGSVS